MRRAARTDTTHKAIVQALRMVGCQVFDASRAGSGFPDLVVRVREPASRYGYALAHGFADHRVMLMEVKGPRGKLTAEQHVFIRDWPEVVIVRSVSEALAAVGIQQG